MSRDGSGEAARFRKLVRLGGVCQFVNQLLPVPFELG